MVVGAAVVAACKHPNPSFAGSSFPHLALAGPQKGSSYVKIFSSNVLQAEAWQPLSGGASDPVSVDARDSLVVWCRAMGEPQAVEAARCCTPEHKGGDVGQGLRSLAQFSLWGD